MLKKYHTEEERRTAWPVLGRQIDLCAQALHRTPMVPILRWSSSEASERHLLDLAGL
jgi:hypothetical protein